MAATAVLSSEFEHDVEVKLPMRNIHVSGDCLTFDMKVVSRAGATRTRDARQRRQCQHTSPSDISNLAPDLNVELFNAWRCLLLKES
ncbi:hypothetical protein J6590_010402 [Homalodisca vitripennis]|nr:hypothetical protein J6590_010402 [Homalodisca vitripennis]